jgi:Pentapeptide repeats (8 copies)
MPARAAAEVAGSAGAPTAEGAITSQGSAGPAGSRDPRSAGGRAPSRLAQWLGAALWWWPVVGVVAVAAAGALSGPLWALVVALVCVAALCGAIGSVIGSWRVAVAGTLVTALLVAVVFLAAHGQVPSVGDGVDLGGARLRGADLANAELKDASLRGADLRDACLRGADLRGADLADADFDGADVSGVEVDEASIAQARNWPEDPATSTACEP